MTRQNINIGTAIGAGNGDPARTAFQKCNDNFIELYDLVNQDQGITVPLTLASDTETDKLRLNGPSSSISGNSTDGSTNYGLLVFTPGQTQIRGAGFGVFTSGIQRLSIDSAGAAVFTGPVTAPSFSGPLIGNAATATTATNQSGGTVAATTGSFSGPVSTNGPSIDSSATTFTAYQSPVTLNFGGGAQNLNIGVRFLSQTINIGSSSEETSTYRFASGPTKSGNIKAVSIGTGALAGSVTNIGIGNEFGGSTRIFSPQTILADVVATNVTAPTFNGALNGNAATATNANSANLLGGLSGSIPAVGSSVAIRDASGFLFASYFNQGSANGENPAVSQVFVSNGSDGFLRKASVAHLTSNLSGSAPISVTGNAGSATVLQTARNINGVSFNGSANISVNTNNSATFNNGGAGAASGSSFNGGAPLTVSYNTVGAPSISGANATGTWNISVTGNAATATTATNVSGGTVSATTGSFSGSLAANGGSLTTSSAAFSLVNANATTVNFAGAATSISIGSASGTATINNAITALKAATVDTVKFPASQVVSGDPNTLDDYEEGSWTPLVLSSGNAHNGTYSIQSGAYIKVGRLVSVRGIVNWTGGTTSLAGILSVGNLPFVAGSSTISTVAIEGNYSATPISGTSVIIGLILPGTANIRMIYRDADGTGGDVLYFRSGQIVVNATYEV